MKTVITVILYNKEIIDSVTVHSLSQLFTPSDCVLNIISNGPKKVSFDSMVIEKLKDKFVALDFDEYLENKPLSMIYNDSFSKYRECERFIFFDDDTIVSEEFLDVLLDDIAGKSYDLKIPRIIEKDIELTCYPLVNDKVYTGVIPKNINDDKVFSIGSGLVVYKSLIDKFMCFGFDVFDERFALYGVDFSLFRRLELLKKKGVKFNISICGTLKHSLSSSEESISEWRYKERLIDLILSVKYYSSSKFLFSYMTLKIILKDIIKKRGRNLRLIFDIFHKGEHPRCTIFKSVSK